MPLESARERFFYIARLMAPRPARLELATRLAVICALTVLIVEIYQTPDAALTVYVAFFFNRGDRAVSLTLQLPFLKVSESDGDLAFFTTWCPAATSIETLVAVEGHRWAIEDSFETAKNELGLDHNESRSWHGWHRHVSLVMLAFAMMAAIRHRANPPPPKKQPRTTASTKAPPRRH